MARARSSRRSPTVFSLSFLDAMTCGFGAVVLLYMVINASVGMRTDNMVGQLKAEAEMLDVDPASRPTMAEVAERFRGRESSTWWRLQLADRRRTRLGGGRRHLIPLVGRRRELEGLSETWTRVSSTQRARVVHLIGPSGSGKSRLVSELAERARRSDQPPMVLYGRAHQEEDRRPCEPILGWLRRALLLPTGSPPGPR